MVFVKPSPSWEKIPRFHDALWTFGNLVTLCIFCAHSIWLASGRDNLNFLQHRHSSSEHSYSFFPILFLFRLACARYIPCLPTFQQKTEKAAPAWAAVQSRLWIQYSSTYLNIKFSVARWQKFRPKSSKGATEKKSWPKEFVAEFWLILPKSGRKGAAENFQKKFLIFNHV